MQEMSRKTQHFTDSVIRRMTRIAIANNAINLAQGFPDFDPPKELTDRLAEVSSLWDSSIPILAEPLSHPIRTISILKRS